MALIIVMWILIILSTIVVAFAYQARLDVKMMSYQMSQERARYVARSGLSRALVYIREDSLKDADDFSDDRDPIIEVDDDDKGLAYDAYSEAWHNNPDNYEEVEFGGNESKPGKLNIKVLDESARLNINSTYIQKHPEVLEALLMYLGNEEETAQAVSAAIVDWIDPDNVPTDAGDEGDWGEKNSEDTYYNPDQKEDEIKEQGPKYVNKNAPLDTIEELLLIKGVTPLIFYGEDANGDAAEDDYKPDDNEDDGDENPPADNEDGDLQLGLKDFVTIYADRERLVNGNTASWQVVAALLYPNHEDDAQDIAEDVVKYRDGFDGIPGTDDDRPGRPPSGTSKDENFLTPGQVDNLTDLDRKLLSQITSNYFRVVSAGEYGGVKKTLTAVVWRDYNPNRLTKSEEMGLEPEDDEEMPEKVILTIMEYNENM